MLAAGPYPLQRHCQSKTLLRQLSSLPLDAGRVSFGHGYRIEVFTGPRGTNDSGYEISSTSYPAEGPSKAISRPPFQHPAVRNDAHGSFGLHGGTGEPRSQHRDSNNRDLGERHTQAVHLDGIPRIVKSRTKELAQGTGIASWTPRSPLDFGPFA